MFLKKNYRVFDTKSLIDKCIDGDTFAWGEFILRFTPLVQKAIERRLENHRFQFSKGDLDDIKQGFFIKLWQDKTLNYVKGAPIINHWICMIASNFATDFYRRNKRDVLRNALSIFEELINDKERYYIEAFLKSESIDIRVKIDSKMFVEKIEEILSDLNPKEKIVVKLNILQGMKYTEIAKILKLSMGTVSSTLNRVKIKIRKRLQENP